MSAEWLEGNRSPLLLPADVIHAINFINSIKTSEYELFNIRRFILIVQRLHWPVHVPSHKGIAQPVKTVMGLKIELKVGQKTDHKKPNMHRDPFGQLKKLTPTYFPIASIIKSFSKVFSHTCFFPFEFLRAQLWTLGTGEWERQKRRCFASPDSKQMSLWTLPRQVRG